MAVPDQAIDGCTRSQRELLRTIADLTDPQARSSSLLPGWTVGHVLTHLARNADSVVRRLGGAMRGEVLDQYPGGLARRASDIEAGAPRPARELVADVRATAGAVEATIMRMSDSSWERDTRDVRGNVQPAYAVVFSRWREVETHHVDLGLGYGWDQWPADLVERWLPTELDRLPERTDRNGLLAWIIGRAEPPAVDPW